ncbi:hypothetical protein ACWEK5_11905 [Rhodococcus koreensis]
MYKTRTGLTLAAPRAFFGWLALASILNWLTVIGVVVFLVFALAGFVGLGSSVAGYVLGWSYFLAGVFLALSWTTLGLVIAYFPCILDMEDYSVGATCKLLVRTRWTIATTVNYGSAFLAILCAKYLNAGVLGRNIMLVAMAVALGIAVRSVRSAHRELRRVARLNATTPLFLQQGGYVDNEESIRFRADFGSEWVYPPLLVDPNAARKFARAAISRSQTLYLTGRVLAWLFGPISLTAFIWVVREDRPPFVVMLPVALLGLALLGWFFERSAARFDGLSKNYADVADSMKPGVPEGPKFPCGVMSWVEVSRPGTPT